jgi:hypothetical protein
LTDNKTAGEISNKLGRDTTSYNAREVGHAMTENIGKHLRECIDAHKSIIDEPEWCVVFVIADDPLIGNMRRRKFYCWPYMPSPRPNQSVFLYNRAADDIIKRLWVLPNAEVMAELTSLGQVNPVYYTMKKWSEAFFHGWVEKWSWKHLKKIWVNTTPSHFFNVIRRQHDIHMLSEHEYILANRDKLMKAGCKLPPPDLSNPFDFDKIQVKKVIDPIIPSLKQSVFNLFGKTKGTQGQIT